MSRYADRIKPTDHNVVTYVEDLRKRKYRIPTFQRDVVWDRESVKLLWDSIFKFYPLGSILIWKTDIRLQNHRYIGGHEIAPHHDFRVEDFHYILDGQQRTTALLTSLHGGSIKGQEGFDPTLYVDLSLDDPEDLDSSSYRERLLFWDEIDDEGGRIRQNAPRKRRYEEGLIVPIRDVFCDFATVERRLGRAGHHDFDDPVRQRLIEIKSVLDNYRLAFIELRGIEVQEVCQIFERINQAGKPLGIFDIVVAKTFRPGSDDIPEFYLRQTFEDFRNGIASPYKIVDDLTLLQMLAVLVMENLPGSGVYNITDRYLNKLKTSHLEDIWASGKKAILKTFDFLHNCLHLAGPNLVPYRYFYMSLATYFFDNPSPDYNFLEQYFWYHALHNTDTLSNTTDLMAHIAFLRAHRNGEPAAFPKFIVDRNKLRTASYHIRSAHSRAVLAFMANRKPRDWGLPQRDVLTDVYYLLTDKPNLHHVFPVGYLSEHPGTSQLDVNSLMNIVYLTQQTNRTIGAQNPLVYLRDFDGPQFESVLQSHLVPIEILDWARQDDMPENALDQFIELRVYMFLEALRRKLEGLDFDIIDTAVSSLPS